MPFSKLTLDFLSENMFRNDRNWYQENKNVYREQVLKPFSELISALEPTLSQIDSDLVCSPKRISRIFRDARYSKGKSIFRDSVWCTFNHGSPIYQGAPSYYFEISPRGFDYGCGYYLASKESIEAIRELIINNDPAFRAALLAYESQSVFELRGEMYKRNRFPEQSKKAGNWLNRKDLYLMGESSDFELLFSDRLIDEVRDGFLAIEPIYKFFMKAETRAVASRL